MADKETRSIFEGEPPGFWISYFPETKTVCVTYPCRRGELLNVALLHNTREGHEDSDDWHSPASLQDLMNTAKDFHPVVQKIFKKAPEVKVYNLTHRAPLSRLSLGKTVIIGDAAHSMLPTHAQGATLALTEAAALEVLFANISDGSEVEARLHLFHDILHPRCAVTQLLSNAPWYQNADLKTQVARYYKGPLPDATALNFSEVYREFFYGWDVRMVVGAALREWEVSKEERVNGEGKE